RSTGTAAPGPSRSRSPSCTGCPWRTRTRSRTRGWASYGRVCAGRRRWCTGSERTTGPAPAGPARALLLGWPGRGERRSLPGRPPARVPGSFMPADGQPDGVIAMARSSDRIDTIVSLSRRRGFVYPSSEIYGGLRASWDYGPLGVEMKNNVKRQWWKAMVQGRDDIVGIDSSVILAREVWQASGHVTEFVDPLTECQSCHKRFRADHLIESYEEKHG